MDVSQTWEVVRSPDTGTVVIKRYVVHLPPDGSASTRAT